MSITIALIGILITILILISIVTNHINQRLNRIENKLISIDNDIKYNQYLINTQENNNSYPDTGKDIRVVVYGNDKEVYKYWRDYMYQCKELLNRLTTTPIRVKIDNKIYTMYYHQGTLTNL